MMKTTGCIFGIAAMLLLVLAASCSNSDMISDIADDAHHTATMKLIGGVRGFDDSRADADGWSDGDVIYLNFNTAGGIVEGKATYIKSTDAWIVSYSGTLTEGVATQCQAYYFDAIESANGNEVSFNYSTAVYADKNASYFYKDGAISITALLMPQTARFRFKGTPGTEFTVYGFNRYDGYSSKALTQSTYWVSTTISSDGYSPYIYGFLSSESRTLFVNNGDYSYSRTINDTEFAQGRTGKFTLPTEDSFTGWEIEYQNKIVVVNGISFKMIYIEAGTFTMGATEEQIGADSNESLAHQVTITKDYYMGATEVTQALWYAVMGQKPTSDGSAWSSTYGLGDNYPAYYISWNDCQEFITKLNQLTGLTFRLPTEAEWEYAARGGNRAIPQTLYSGSNIIDNVAWYTSNSSKSQLVAGKAENVLGLYDMSGNVWEWCNDWYGSYGSSPQTDPTGPTCATSGSNRVLRGGGWNSGSSGCRVAFRSNSSVTNRGSNIGMRLVLGDPLPEPDTLMTITANGVSFNMKFVESGTFTMGATAEQTGAFGDESPAHQVTLTKDYYLGETEVTQALWYAVMGQKPTSDGSAWESSYGLGDNYPAYYISWNDCQEFISKLNQLTGLTFRLPTEAEWEYAARGGNKATTQTLYSGSNTIGDVAWYDENSSSSTHAVAGKSANALGLYDMSGNVWEWCNDWDGWYSSGAQTDPTGPSSGSARMVRGGCWSDFAASCRVAYRGGVYVTHRFNSVGMRLALTVE
ncbi:MAG: formylglycine-generating enzyme family protein [Bacteroidales bacterium]|nr:formylglycine-generating enzyme family protein [Bacteroidales bacterium]